MEGNPTKNVAVWRSRRGMIELDILLKPFAESAFDSLSCSERQIYVQLLELDDVEILDFLKDPTQAGLFEDILKSILSFRESTVSNSS